MPFAACKLAQQNAQILNHDFKTPRYYPRGQIFGQHAPMTTGFGDIAKPLEDIAQRIIPLWSILAAQR
jgi:hypothetical protein